MAKVFRYISFRDATQASRTHPAEVDAPMVCTLRNFYLSRSDRVPTMRGDMQRFRDDTYSLAGYWLAQRATVSEYLNTLITGPIAQSQVFLTSLCPSAILGSYGAPTANTIDDGTVTTLGTKVTKAGSTAVGSLTACSSDGTSTVAKVSTWGFTPIVGDLVQITSSDVTADEGWYVLTDFVQDASLTLSHNVTGTSSVVALSVSRSWLTTVHPHCFISFAGSTTVYRVAQVTADGILYLDDGDYPSPAVSGVTYSIMQVHDGDRAVAPFQVARFNDVLIYQAVNPLESDKATICGPFYAQGDWSGDELTDYSGTSVKTITDTTPSLLAHTSITAEAGATAALSGNYLTYAGRSYDLGAWSSARNAIAYKADAPIRYVIVGDDGLIISAPTLTRLVSYFPADAIPWLKLSAIGTTPTVTVDHATSTLTVTINSTPQSWTLTDTANNTMGAMRRHLDGYSLGDGAISATLPTPTGTYNRLNLTCDDGTSPTVTVADGTLTLTVNATPAAYDLTNTLYSTFRKLQRQLDGITVGDGTIQATLAASVTQGQMFTLAMTGGVTPTAEVSAAGVLSVYSDADTFNLLDISAIGTTPTVEVTATNLVVTINSVSQTFVLASYTARELSNALNALQIGGGTVTCMMNGTADHVYAMRILSVSPGCPTINVVVNDGSITASSGGETKTWLFSSFPGFGYYIHFDNGATIWVWSDDPFSYRPTFSPDECSFTLVGGTTGQNETLYQSVFARDNTPASSLSILGSTPISTTVTLAAGVAGDTRTWTIPSYDSCALLVAAINADPTVGPGTLTAAVGTDSTRSPSTYDTKVATALSSTPLSFTGSTTADDNLPTQNLDAVTSESIATTLTLTEQTFAESGYASNLLDDVTDLDISTEQTLISTADPSIWVSCAGGTTMTLDIADRVLTITVDGTDESVDLLTYTIATIVTWLDGRVVNGGTVTAYADPRGYVASRPANALEDKTALDISTEQQIMAIAVVGFTQQTSGVTTDLHDVYYDASAGMFVTVGDDGTVLHSTDGSTWVPASSPANSVTDLMTVRYDAGWEAVGTYLRDYYDWTSADADTWASAIRLVPGLQALVASTSGIAVVGPDLALWSPDGSTWNAETPGDTGWFNAIDWFTDCNFVAVGEGGIIQSSADGETWATETSGTTASLYGVSYGDNTTTSEGLTFMAMAVGAQGGGAVYSDDFESDTIGAAPSGFTCTYPGTSPWEVASGGPTGSTKMLKAQDASFDYTTLDWDSPGSAGPNIDLTFDVYHDGLGGGTGEAYAFVQWFFDGAYAVRANFGKDNGAGIEVSLWRNSGGWARLTGTSLSGSNPGDWDRIQFRVVGTTFNLRWAKLPNELPTTWQITDYTLPASPSAGTLTILTYVGTWSSQQAQRCVDNIFLGAPGWNAPTVIFSSTPGTWETGHTGKTGLDLNAVLGHGWNFVAVGTDGTILRTIEDATPDDPAGWSQVISGTSYDLNAICALDTTIFVCGDNGTLLTSTNQTTWSAISLGVTDNLYCCTSDSDSSVLIAGAGGLCMASTDGGVTWATVPVPTTDDILSITYSPSQTAFFACTKTEIIRIARSGYGSELTWKPLSPAYRGTAFVSVDGYVMLLNTSEWNDTDKIWDHHYRRIRWTSPMTYNDFASTGAGYADVTGFGAFLDARAIAHNVIVAEEHAISALTPSGDPDNPWDYRVLRENFWAISNLCVVDDICYFIGPDGTLYAATAIQVQAVPCQLDMSTFSDAASTTPVQLTFDRDRQLLTAFQPSGTGDQTIWTVNLESGSVSSYTIPTVNYETGATMPMRAAVQVVNAFEPIGVTPGRQAPS